MTQIEEKIKQLMMKHLDGESTPAEEKELAELLEKYPAYRDELNMFQQLKKETGEMKNDMLPELVWEDYWQKLYNRMERGVSWLLISLGSVILISFGLYQMLLGIVRATNAPFLIKFGLLALIVGGVILLVSVVREKLLLRKHDKYKEVRR